jgi:Zn-dependent protease with chaperone function
VLEPDEVTALIAHEAGHEANGDPLRSVVVGSAADALAALVAALTPAHGEGRAEFASLADGASALMRLLALPFALLLQLQLLLVFRDAQRAEYLADHRAALVAGTEAGVRVIEKLLLGAYLDGVVQRHALDGRNDESEILAELRDAARAIPEREWERRRRVAALELPALLATHPTSARRAEVHRRRAPLAPALVLDDARAAAILAELAPYEVEAGRVLVDRWRGGRRMA